MPNQKSENPSYGGHKPKWLEDQDFYSRMECGKVHPGYMPAVTKYNTLVQPTQTPRDLNNIQEPPE